ncbi:MAG: FAD-dependent oxidoreductase, partial [Myxococcales bacterium]|nr:FAD-dependent oxidoreductase [Polyangiaceae bacterium]MDW8248379.1 FAD-dependent oxidoreductase [Myxococcales bacterium]
MSDERSLWAWGYEGRRPDPEALRSLVSSLLGVPVGPPASATPLDEFAMPEPRMEVPDKLRGICSTDRRDRAMHTYGKAFRDQVRAFRGDFRVAPDVVARPRDEEEVGAVLAWAEAEGAAVIPFGGGTSVVGGVEAPGGERRAVSLDLERMDRVLEVDRESLAARIQAGAKGPWLERQLAEHGLTLRHYPQSFEFSTLGGWIATRAGGHFATLYTHIDELVESLRVVTPR